MINFAFKIQFAEIAGEKPPTEQETIKFFAEFIPKLIVWGDENVMKSFCLFRDTAADNTDRPSSKILFIFEDVLFNIRKDLGHKDKKIKKGDILGLFITDIKKHLQPPT